MSTRLDLTTLELFVTVVEERSLARASERKRIAVSAISRRIAELEQAFSVRLLNRRHNGIEPTAAGLTLLAHARDMLRDAEQLESELRGYAQGSQGLIRIKVTESAVFGIVPDVLKSFLDLHPMVRIECQEATSPMVVRAVMENLADIGIFVGRVPLEELEQFVFHTDRLGVVVPCDHALASRTRVRFEELLDEAFISQEADSATEQLMQSAAARAGRPVKSRIRVAGFDAACRMVEAGLGIAITPEPITAKLAPFMRLAQIGLDEPWAVRPHSICVRKATGLPTAARRLLTHFVSQGSVAEPALSAMASMILVEAARIPRRETTHAMLR